MFLIPYTNLNLNSLTGKRIRQLIGAMLLVLLYSPGHGQNYKISLLRAAPGEMLTLLDELKVKAAAYPPHANVSPLIIRHSQGDHWDYMIIEYTGVLAEYIGREEATTFSPAYGDPFYRLVSHHEQVFMNGPEPAIYSEVAETFGYFHIEMFVALAGKQDALLNERKMENVYLSEIGRDPNLIFTAVMGASWDNMTLGGYRDIKHFAESADISFEQEEQAAIKAGFKGVNDLSPALRALLLRHNDTLGNKVDYSQEAK